MSDSMTEEWVTLLHQALAKHQEFSQKLLDAKGYLPEQDMKQFAKLEPLVQLGHRLRTLETRRKEAEEILEEHKDDKDMFALAKNELEDVTTQWEELRERVIDQTQDKEEIDEDRGAILEVRASAGGDEAALFAADLWRMYQRYCELKRWSFQVLSYSASDLEGCREGIAKIEGKGIWKKLRYESGVHRVQRVPQTETSGRIHTSTASVMILPEAETIDVVINDKDLKVETYRAQGAGGQHVNKTDSAVRITHFPTGIIAQCQDDKSQHRNRDRAMQVLRARIADKLAQEAQSERSKHRRSLINTGDRSERIRTYNFPQNRVSDHRINATWHKLDRILDSSALDAVLDRVVESLNVRNAGATDNTP